MCDDCGTLRCECNRTTRDDSFDFVIHDFEVLTVSEFRNRDSNASVFDLMVKTKYETREEAELNARISCEEAVEAARQNLLRLKKICKVIRPWERKSK